MNNWVFLTVGHLPNAKVGEPAHVRTVFCERVKHQFWPLRKSTPGRRVVAVGDNIIFYLARPECTFVGTAKVSLAAFEVVDSQLREFAAVDKYRAEYGVGITSIKLWKAAVEIRPLVPTLEVFPDKDRWGAHFQSGVIRLSNEDYQQILKGAKGVKN